MDMLASRCKRIMIHKTSDLFAMSITVSFDFSITINLCSNILFLKNRRFWDKNCLRSVFVVKGSEMYYYNVLHGRTWRNYDWIVI